MSLTSHERVNALNKNQFFLMITKVKNEADIIEAFIRYHIHIFDKIVVLDNGSLDGTYEILKLLAEEGLNIEIVNEAAGEFDSFRLANKYAKKYVTETNADFLVFMDADEFLISEDGINPREILEKLTKDKIYYIHWKTYLYQECGEFNYFLPELFEYYRDETHESFTKIIVPGELFKKQRIVVLEGNHEFSSLQQIPVMFTDLLKFAHYPLRSLWQHQKQMVLNAIGIMETPNYLKDASLHWKQMYQEMDGMVNLYEKSLKYAFYDGEKIYKGSIGDIFNIKNDMKYFENQISDFIKILMMNSEIQALKIKAGILKNKMTEFSTGRKKLLVYGAGEQCQKRVCKINQDRYEIVAFVDSNRSKQFAIFENHIVIAPEKMRFFAFDLIVVAASKYYAEITARIQEELIDFSEEKVVDIESFLISDYEADI